MAALYQQIGQLKVELDWIKKKRGSSDVGAPRALVAPSHPRISIARQCELLGLSRAGYYYHSRGESEENVRLMRLLDEQYTRTPFYGVRRMKAWLESLAYVANLKRVRRLLRTMGLEAIYPKPRLSVNGSEHRRFPYLLRGLTIQRPNHVWCADITYIRLLGGFVYLVAIMDWASRYVLAWDLSTTLDADFCVSALEEALQCGQPDILNTDQGVQFTSAAFIGCLEQACIKISMDGRGRVFDNIFVERLWRSLKYEEVYLHDYQTPGEARLGLERYFRFYNGERLHQALGYRTPAVVWAGA